MKQECITLCETSGKISITIRDSKTKSHFAKVRVFLFIYFFFLTLGVDVNNFIYYFKQK